VVLGGGSRGDGRARATELLERVGLPATAADGYPHEFSGGQRQRIAIARTLAAGPSCLIADEPISALDASAQAQVANLLTVLVREEGIGLLLVSHDLSVVRQVADRVAVMYLGRIVEVGGTAAVWSSPRHPYTEALVAAIPRADGAGVLPADLPGDVPDPASPPSGCRFHPRCPAARDDCAVIEQHLVTVAGRQVACHVRAPLPDGPGATGEPGAASLCGWSTRTSSTCCPATCCPPARSRPPPTAPSPRSPPARRPACRTGR
jgi:peptide/nickel transport system ATP-binding protein